MGITKTEYFEEKVNQMSDIFKAIGNPARLSILLYLSQRNSCVCTEIVNELPLAQPTISRHLSELKRVGLIKGNIEGKNICYCIDGVIWAKVIQQINDISIAINQQANCC